jgi:hypothetical protein
MLGWLITEVEKEKRPGGGGGGRARVRLGRTGPRGRIYAKPAVAHGATVIAKNKYLKAGKGSGAAIREHLRYIQERERGEQEQERKFFDRERDGIERQEVNKAMLENRGERVAMHRLMLSPGDNKVDIREYARESMEALEERLGHKLDWYATVHENTEHHHAHVVIAGKVPGFERQIERREEREDAEFYDRLVKEELSWGNEKRELEILLGQPIEDREHDLEREEREEIDPRDRDVIPEMPRSAEELRVEKMLDRYEREMAAREEAGVRGDVYLDVSDLRELRSAGNDYVNRERSLDRTLERVYEREFERDYEREREREPERVIDVERSSWDEIASRFEEDRQVKYESEQSNKREEREHEREDRERGDDDMFGR